VKLWIVAVGHRMPAWVGAGFEDYARRMPREARMTLVEVKPQHRRSAGAAPADIERALEAERRRIAAALPKDCYKVVLDERGRDLTTRELSARMGAWRRGGRDVGFVVGGADGTAAGLRSEADLLWSLSRLTLPHQLVRVLLAEQLYRAVSMLGGHPYHRE
jgi:23S rRNA (pseudouridine1915-N3)-methyltransferase